MKLPDYLLWNRSHRGEALVDLILGTAILGIIMPSLFSALLGILGQSAQTSKMIQANWVANSYMEEVMGFSFDDVDDFDSDTYNEYGLEVAISVEGAVVDGVAGTISIPLSPPVDPDYKQVQVTVSGGGLNENIVLKTLVASEESFGRIVGTVLDKTSGGSAPIPGDPSISVDGCASCQYNGGIQGDGNYVIDQVPLGPQTVRVDVSRGVTGQDFVVADGFSNPKTETIVRGDNTIDFDFVLGIDIQWAFNNIGTGITNPRGEPHPYPWTQTGGSLTVMFEDDSNCKQDMFTFQDVLEDEGYSQVPAGWPGTWTQTHRRGDNPGGGGQQVTQATATITIRGGAHNMRVRWTGIGEAQDAGFDRVGFFIGLSGGAEVEHSRSYAPGGKLGCARMALVETTRCPPAGCGDNKCSGGCGGTIQTDADGDGWFEMNETLPNGTHTLRIRADSADGWYHYMSFFMIDVRITKN